MTMPKFDPKEMEVVAEVPAFGGAPVPVYNFPATMKEGALAAMQRKPLWQVTYMEQTLFCPRVNPDNIARAFVFEADFMPPHLGGGKDMFGIEWEYVPAAGGSMVRPGKPFIEDANEIEEKVVWPDIDSWDWEAAGKANEGYLGGNGYNMCWFLNGWYERLISFMDFEGAIMAMIDEDQMDAVKAFFDKLSDLYIRIIDKYLEYFPQIDCFYMHDDWGAQKETFFSPATVAEMIVPYMRKVTDHIHAKGKVCELHSCGQILKQVPNIIAAGWDAWCGQPMNDTHKAYELYGDQIIIGVAPQDLDPTGKTEEEQRACAREYAARFCNPNKPSVFNFNTTGMITPAFREELYKASRKAYCGE